VSKNEKTFEVKHLEKCIEGEDKMLNSIDWFKHGLIKGLLQNAVFYLEKSTETGRELNYSTDLYKLINE